MTFIQIVESCRERFSSIMSSEVGSGLFCFLAGEYYVIVGFFVFGMICALGMLLGYRTRLSTFLLWLVMCSIHLRLPLATHGGDDLLRLLLFWSWLAPLNLSFSMDQWITRLQGKDRSSAPSHQILFSFGVLGLMLQLAYMYFFTAFLKWHPVWHTDGSAIYYALQLDIFRRPLGEFLLGYPQLLQILTFATLIFEFVGPLLIFSPIWTAPLRALLVVSFIGFHMGLAMTIQLGTFPWLFSVAWLMFLPSFVWDKWINSLSLWKFLQEKIHQSLLELRTKSFFSVFNQGFSSPRARWGRASEIMAVIFIFLGLFANLRHFESLGLKNPEFLRAIYSLTFTFQKWNLFAPYPIRDDGWVVIEGTLFNGRAVELRTGEEPSFDKPKDVPGSYINPYWRKYLMSLWSKQNDHYRLPYGRYLCREWNKNHSGDERVNLIHIHYMLEETPPPGNPIPPPSKKLIWRHYCFDKPADW